jgi:putative phosphoesterase
MTRIGLISDTHGYLDEQVFQHFESCDEIWHAGDFGTIEVANRLKDLPAGKAGKKSLRGVYGNVDGNDIRALYPEYLSFQCEDVKVLMIHIGGYPPKYNPHSRELIKTLQPQLFISGHSHILKVMYDEQMKCLHMNPGAAGKHGMHQMRTIIRFAIDGNNITNCEVIELGKRAAMI